MALVLTAAPAAEPVSLAEAKAHLRVDADHEDALIGQLIVAARMFVERTLGLALLTQSWSYFLDHWPLSSCITLPIAPVQSIAAVKLHGADGGTTTLDAQSYAVDMLSQPGRIVLNGAMPAVVPRTLNAFEVSLLAGYGDEPDDVPETLRHALVLLVAHWFERREPVVLGVAAQEVPSTVAGLLLPYRRGEAVTEFLPSDLRHRLVLEERSAKRTKAAASPRVGSRWRSFPPTFAPSAVAKESKPIGSRAVSRMRSPCAIGRECSPPCASAKRPACSTS
jgi:uncharacterized phiE125 gp8 family phage protein